MAAIWYVSLIPGFSNILHIIATGNRYNYWVAIRGNLINFNSLLCFDAGINVIGNMCANGKSIDGV